MKTVRLQGSRWEFRPAENILVIYGGELGHICVNDFSTARYPANGISAAAYAAASHSILGPTSGSSIFIPVITLKLINCLNETEVCYEILNHTEAFTAQSIAAAEHMG